MFTSAVFSNVVNLNSTQSNATVPFGLWALPTLGDLPTFNLTHSGRKKRSIDNNSFDHYEYVNDVKMDLEDQFNQYLMNHDPANAVGQIRQILKSLVLIDSNQECQAAFGCRSVRIYMRTIMLSSEESTLHADTD